MMLDVTDPTARAAIAVLADAGMLEETTGRTWDRIYVSAPILAILLNDGVGARIAPPSASSPGMPDA